MKKLILAAAMSVVAWPVLAGEDDMIKVQSQNDVATTMDTLEAAVTGAGAKVFARVDHAAGAKSANLDLAPAQVLIFGNPKLGTPAMQDNPLAGYYLPLKVLVYEDATGEVWLAYEAPKDMLDDLPGISGDAEYIAKMTGALGKLTAKAAGE